MGCQFRWTFDSEFIFITYKLCDPRQFTSSCSHFSICGKLFQELPRIPKSEAVQIPFDEWHNIDM